VYNIDQLNSLRHYSHLYFHGHSVGGTNPSLLEAMASSALIVANDNVFNRAVLEEDAFYFSDAAQIAKLLNSDLQKDHYNHFIERNRRKIDESYSWEHITDLLETSLRAAVQHRSN
jgi:glycosyltransferase involved in cell wall biosynthesis